MECVAGIARSSPEARENTTSRQPRALRFVAFKARKLPLALSFRDTPFFMNQSAFRNVRLTRRCPSFGCSPSLTVETP